MTNSPEAMKSFEASFLEKWTHLSSRNRPRYLASLRPAEQEYARHRWQLWWRPDQTPPLAAENGARWTTWLLLGGRGAGKTRAGAEWVRGIVKGKLPFSDVPVTRIALVGETAADAREVMIEGEAGILRVHPRHERPVWESSRRRLVWPNGAVAHAFSADDPEQLRGPQFEAAWCDELCKWRRATAAFDMLQFGLRLGAQPRQVITTTPRPLALLKRIMQDPLTVVSRAATAANALNLAPTFLDRISARYAGTRLGRQELDGEIIEDMPGALFPRAAIERGRVDAAPALARIVVAVDPPASSREGADLCGLVAVGRGADERLYVLADETAARRSPLEWAS
ncbi:MAG: terminase family protein, partial [Candidatus Binatia bacterium]